MVFGLRMFPRGEEPFVIASNPASVKEEGGFAVENVGTLISLVPSE